MCNYICVYLYVYIYIYVYVCVYIYIYIWGYQGIVELVAGPLWGPRPGFSRRGGRGFRNEASILQGPA